jgi:hypothetical protein
LRWVLVPTLQLVQPACPIVVRLHRVHEQHHDDRLALAVNHLKAIFDSSCAVHRCYRAVHCTT